ncbi:MAG: uracil-DNA glycosylase [Candidatus Marinimicrobia bacterium]|nr:uracil-DNA glycosylase [Candidatus Neomarinimicrobiota bacterium]
MTISKLNEELIECTLCDRLVDFREKIAIEKRKSFESWNYWGKPVPGYGNDKARLLILGLAPAAHGGNRTGRVFTGDKSAEFLMKCLHETGFANQNNSDSRNDGLILYDAFMTVALKCVPPGDKPLPEELRNCQPFLAKEFELLSEVSTILCLGKIAFDATLRYWRQFYDFKMKDYTFGHDVCYSLPNGLQLVGSYHPSPRNVNTKRLTYDMMIEFLIKLKGIL